LEQHFRHKDFVETAVEIKDWPKLALLQPRFISAFLTTNMLKKIFICTNHGR
jgi:hypothetical protein